MLFEPFGALHFRSASRPSLLCDRIPCPILPGIGCSQVTEPVLWSESPSPLSKKSVESTWQSLASHLPKADLESAAGLFLAAHVALLRSDLPSAERSIQKAIAIQGRQPDESPHRTPGASWFVLAAASLLKRDLDSCETWLKAAERTLHAKGSDVDSPEFRHAVGDLFVLQGCLYAQTSHHAKAGRLMIEAFRCHLESESYLSAATDLILRARLLMLDRDWTAAAEILTQAESTLQRASNATSQSRQLQATIDKDRLAIAKSMHAFLVAECN